MILETRIYQIILEIIISYTLDLAKKNKQKTSKENVESASWWIVAIYDLKKKSERRD